MPNIITNGNIAGKIEKTNIMHTPHTSKNNAPFAKTANPFESNITLNIANIIIQCHSVKHHFSGFLS